MKCLPNLLKISIYFLYLNLNWISFEINGFKIFRCDRNRYGDDLILYAHEGIRCKPLKTQLFDPNIEIIGLEFHQIKWKWLFVGTYKPPVINDLEFTNKLIKILNHLSSKYENLTVIGDLNMSIENVHLNTLCNCSV